MGSTTQLWNFGGEALDDSHVNVDCGPKVQGQCGGQIYSKRLLTLMERIYLPGRECGERTKGRGAPRKGRGEGQLFRVYEALTGMKRGAELWLGPSEAVRST